ICLGMQLLARRSEEGRLPGLGWIAADVVRFRPAPGDATLKVPHMGWNRALPTGPSALFDGLDDEDAGFYFVHSYHLVCDDEADVSALTPHGTRFASAVRRGNLYGTQFHPEKSHRYGLRLLRNFAERT